MSITGRYISIVLFMLTLAISCAHITRQTTGYFNIVPDDALAPGDGGSLSSIILTHKFSRGLSFENKFQQPVAINVRESCHLQNSNLCILKTIQHIEEVSAHDHQKCSWIFLKKITVVSFSITFFTWWFQRVCNPDYVNIMLLMPWLFTSPGDQQLWYWLYKIGPLACEWFLLCIFSVKEWG